MLAFDQALARSADAPWPAIRRGMLLNELGRRAEAKASLEEAIRRDPKVPQAWVLLTVAQLAEGDPIRALESARRVEELAPDQAWGPRLQGAILKATGRLRAARRQLEEAERREPGNPDTAKLLAELEQREATLQAAAAEGPN